MSTIIEVKAQCQEIARLVNALRDYLVKPSTLQFFRENPSLGSTLVTNTSSLKSKAMVLWGLKDSIETTTDFLPTNDQLSEGRTDAWLSVGDVIAGWIDYLADRPRIVVATELNGYTWRWFDDPESTVRGPGLGRMKTDKFFQSHGWVKLEGSTLAEISEEQATEISELNTLIAYFSSKAFLRVD
jgi:hypothetical protein